MTDIKSKTMTTSSELYFREAPTQLINRRIILLGRSSAGMK
jgi:hypothetical protein